MTKHFTEQSTEELNVKIPQTLFRDFNFLNFTVAGIKIFSTTQLPHGLAD